MKKIICILIVLCYFQSNAQKSVYNFAKIDSIGVLLDTSITNSHKKHFNKFFDKEKFYKKVSGTKKSKNSTIIQKNLKDGFVESFDYGQELINTFINGGSYSYLHFYLDENSEFHLVFRLISDAGLNYQDILLKYNDGDYYIADIYNYYEGENLSKTYKQIYKNILYRMVSEKNNFKYVDATQIFNLTNKLIAKGKFKKADKLFKKTPKEFITQKKFQMLKVEIASKLGEKKYTTAIKEYENTHPNDFSVEFLKLDYYSALNQQDKVLEQLDKLNKKIDQDIFLQYTKSTVYLEMKKYKSAENDLKAIVEAYPTYLDAYNSLLFCYVKQHKVQEFISLLEMYNKQFNFKKQQVIEFIKKEYPIILQEDLYKDWLQKK